MPRSSKHHPQSEVFDRDSIVRTGLRLLDEVGLDKLSLRRIADEFGVQTPALYWHIRNREELFGLMADEMLREALATIDPRVVGRDFLIAFGRAVTQIQAKRRDAARLLAASPPTDVGKSLVESEVIVRLARGGVVNASDAAMAIFSFTLGWSLLTSHPPMKEHLVSGMDLRTTFEACLTGIAAGFDEGLCSESR